MKVEFAKKEIKEMVVGLPAIMGEKMDRKLAYAIAKNSDFIERENKAIDEEIKKIEGYADYEKERMETVRQFSQKNPQGEPIVRAGRYPIEDEYKFNLALEELQKKHKKALDEFNDMLEEKVTTDCHMTTLDTVPEQISAAQMRMIMKFVQDEPVLKSVDSKPKVSDIRSKKKGE